MPSNHQPIEREEHLLSKNLKLNYCRLCQYRKQNLQTGVYCGKDSLPKIEGDTCSSFEPEVDRVYQAYDLHKRANRFDFGYFYKTWYSWCVFLLLFFKQPIADTIKKYSFTEEYRYTIAHTRIEEQGGLDYKFLWFGGINKTVLFSYQLNGQYYLLTDEFRSEKEIGFPKKVLIKYDQLNPNDFRVERSVDVSNVDTENLPVNGFDKDALGQFLYQY
ncbi:hypothetical protein [Persicobacter psychrovividus]|uniref:Uncharacterized protein n=1 Tax=Persicobacter psychrovividus TaxID=387638 RepID=A0ABM7VB34_9BACT|nr:hypothetical protein PEPS_03920 [Persicobacter psychrovividus]